MMPTYLAFGLNFTEFSVRRIKPSVHFERYKVRRGDSLEWVWMLDARWFIFWAQSGRD